MTERGLPIVDGAPACPFVAFADDRDERAASPDHRHRCYAEAKPAPRALAHQEAYCLSSAFPVCPTFQDWARREAAHAREDAARAAEADSARDMGQPQRNPPRNWAAPPPWLSRSGKDRGEGPPPGSLWAEDEPGPDDPMAPFEDPAEPRVPTRGRGLSGSYADRVASDPASAAEIGAAGIAAGAVGAGAMAAGAPPAAKVPAAQPVAPLPPVAQPSVAPPPAAQPVAYHVPEAWDDEAADPDEDTPPRTRRREREVVRGDRTGRPDRPDGKRQGPAPEWERAKPLEAYPTIRSRRLSELSIPPILVAVVALALAAAVLFALPGLLGFGSPQAGASASPTIPVQTAVPSVNPTPVPVPTAQIYIVQAGDTMSKIAGRFGIPLQTLIDANTQTVPDPNKLQIGDQVIIPAKTVTPASEIPGAT
jgi:hypothetical protein